MHLPSRTPRTAIQDLAEPIGAVLRCVTDAGFVVRDRQPGGVYVAHLQGHRVRLRRGPGLDSLQLKVSTDFAVDAPSKRSGWWEARKAGWVYEIRSGAGDLILAFHWHPHSGRVTWPHLHAYGANDAVELHRLHPPTGPIAAGSIVRFLIEDLDVVPRRQDWQAILDRHATT